MGWDYWHEPEVKPAQQIITENFPGIIDLHLWPYNGTDDDPNWVAYAVRQTPAGERYLMVALVDYRERPAPNFGIKVMDESMGPCYYGAPSRLLDQLTEPRAEHVSDKYRAQHILQIKAYRELCRLQERGRAGDILAQRSFTTLHAELGKLTPDWRLVSFMVSGWDAALAKVRPL